MKKLAVEISKSFPAGLDSAPFELAVRFAAGDGITALFGPSGAGKTLTLESIAGFARPDRGHIELDGEVFFDSARRIDRPARARRCGYVFQKDALFPHMSIRENLRFAAEALSRRERAARVSEILSHFHLEPLAGRRPQEVSGGERQRCAIARTLVSGPRLLLLDEPARGLDIGLRRQLYATLRQVRLQYGIGMILVTHDLEEAFELADRMLVYHAGRIEQQGEPREVYERPASTRVAQLFGIFGIFEGRVLAVDSERDSTRLEANEMAIETTYLQGRRPGELVQFCIHPERVVATPSNGSKRDARLTLAVREAVRLPDQVRLEFPGNLSAVVSRELFEQEKDTREWAVEFPEGSVWVFPEDQTTHPG